MSVKRCSLCLVFVLALILLGACTWPTPTPGCSVTDLVQPIPSGPPHNQTDLSLTTSILWSYGAGYECQPDGFVLQIAHDQLFTDVVAEVETVTTMWTVSPALDPADEYWWRVAGGVGTAGSLSLGPWSERQRFFTGPVCTAAQLVAPIPLAPPNGGIMDEEWGPVYFDYPASAGCLPQYYRMLLSTTFDFADTSLNGWIPHPAEAWGPGDAYLDCTTYYWSAVPVADSTDGPMSPPWSFFVDLTGSCAASASVSGLVWHDLCAVPYESTTTPAPGCIMLPGGGMAADGLRDAGEPGIPGITVDIGAGPCPSSGYATAVTLADGTYELTGLPAGDYCVSVDPFNHGNDLVLIPGGWTSPDRDVTIAEHDISLGAGVPLMNIAFGWDYQFLPSPATPTVVPIPTFLPSPTPVYYSLQPFIDANCRSGPGLEFSAIGFLLEGETAEVNARNAANTWWRVYLASILGNCWISDATVDINFDPSGLPVVVVPTPTPTPPACLSTLDRTGCEAAGGTWVQTATHAGYCQCP